MSEFKGNNAGASAPNSGYRKPYNKPNFQNRNNNGQGRGNFNPRGKFNNNNNGNRRPAFNKRPRVQLSPEKLEQLKAAKARKAQLEATRKALIEAFPQTFSYKEIKPLKVDVHLDIFDYFDSANQPSDSPVKKVAIRQFLAQYIRSRDYHLATLRAAKRYDLQGNVVAELTEEELKYHQQHLKQAQNNRPARKPQGFRPRPNGARSFIKRLHGAAPAYPRFKVGDIVLLNGREGSITKIEDNKYRVQFLDSKLSINVDAKQSYTMKKKFNNNNRGPRQFNNHHNNHNNNYRKNENNNNNQ